MPRRFTVEARDGVVDIVFNDDGMNLLSSAALAELSEIISSPPCGTGVSPVPAASNGEDLRSPDEGEQVRDLSHTSDEDKRGQHLSHTGLLTLRSGRESIFAAGADMGEMARFTADDARAFAAAGQTLFAAIERLSCLTVALIDGDCFGGALDLAMAFDLRFATGRSRFAHPGAKIGIVTGFGGTQRWRSVVAPAVARRLFLSNETLGAGAALQAGLIDMLFRTFDGREYERARDLAEMNRESLVVIKDLARGEGMSARDLLDVADRAEERGYGPP